jgi:hypothetical protein
VKCKYQAEIRYCYGCFGNGSSPCVLAHDIFYVRYTSDEDSIKGSECPHGNRQVWEDKREV